jgi:rhodanese-related sulfurtransferase
VTGFTIVDARSREAFEAEHIPNAVSLPHREISEETTQHFSREILLIIYCDGPGCNAAAKAALRLARLGFSVKELAGGIFWWKTIDRFPTVQHGPGTSAGPAACGCDIRENG